MVLEQITTWRKKREQTAINKLRHERVRLEERAKIHRVLQSEQDRISQAQTVIAKTKKHSVSGKLAKAGSIARAISTEVVKNYNAESKRSRKKSTNFGFEVPSYGGFGEPTKRKTRRRKPAKRRTTKRRTTKRRTTTRRRSPQRRRTRRQPTSTWQW